MSTEDLNMGEMPEEPPTPKRKRKRIYPSERVDSGIPPTASKVFDPLEWRSNRCTLRARQTDEAKAVITLDLWFDHHYYIRDQQGDDFGAREGIGIDVVKGMVTRSLKHLLFYGARLEKFTFLNHNPSHMRAQRVVIREDIDGGILNAAIEIHFDSINRYEITVKTAMVVDNFDIADGQYCVELQGDSSILYRMLSGSLKEICSI